MIWWDWSMLKIDVWKHVCWGGFSRWTKYGSTEHKRGSAVSLFVLRKDRHLWIAACVLLYTGQPTIGTPKCQCTVIDYPFDFYGFRWIFLLNNRKFASEYLIRTQFPSSFSFFSFKPNPYFYAKYLIICTNYIYIYMFY